MRSVLGVAPCPRTYCDVQDGADKEAQPGGGGLLEDDDDGDGGAEDFFVLASKCRTAAPASDLTALDGEQRLYDSV